MKQPRIRQLVLPCISIQKVVSFESKMHLQAVYKMEFQALQLAFKHWRRRASMKSERRRMLWQLQVAVSAHCNRLYVHTFSTWRTAARKSSLEQTRLQILGQTLVCWNALAGEKAQSARRHVCRSKLRKRGYHSEVRL
jgi:hypothetical protein